MDAFIDSATTADGTHMPRSDWSVVSRFELDLPDIIEQNAMAEVLVDQEAEITLIREQLAKLGRARMA